MLLNFARRALGDFVKAAPFLAAALIAAAVVHIAATLTLGSFGAPPPFARLKAGLPVNKVVVLAAITPDNQPLPFMMPHMAYAVCRYDVSSGPVHIKAALEAAGWSLSLHSPAGDNFHLVAGIAQRLTPVELILVPPGNRFYAHRPELLFTNEQIPEVRPAYAEGLAVLRAPVRSAAHRPTVERMLQAATCQQIATPARAPVAAAPALTSRR